MLEYQQQRLREDIRKWAGQFGGTRSALIPILHEVQRGYGYISTVAVQYIAESLNVLPVQVDGVVSFYSFFNRKPKGRFVIRLCGTISCDMQGKDKVAKQLENEVGARFGETSADGLFTLEWTQCIGMCDQGPALIVNDRIYTRVTPFKVSSIISELKKAEKDYEPFMKEAGADVD
jgi:[NiFe] hydrogenase diaphorase moiety large subunit